MAAGVAAWCVLPPTTVATAATTAPPTLPSPPPRAGGGVTVGGRQVFTACPEVSCKSKEELAAEFLKADAPPGLRRRLPSTTSSIPTTSTATTTTTPPPAPPSDCPLDREELGRAAWGFLHTVAAYYPEVPTDADRAGAAALVTALRQLYPCTHCRAQLAVDLDSNPLRAGSRGELVLWMCEQHNAVNELLGKPSVPCSLPALDARWRTGRPACWLGAAQTASESLGQGGDDDDDDTAPAAAST